MPLNDTAKTLMLDALGAVAVFASAHSADPGTTGTDEVAGGTPAYIRKAIAWAAAAAGSMAKTASAVVFDIEGGDTVAFVGYWSAETAGTFYGSADVTDEVFGGQGTYTLTAATCSLT
jgi:hypothetical protein